MLELIAIVSLLLSAGDARTPPGPSPTFNVVERADPEKGHLYYIATLRDVVPVIVEEKVIDENGRVIIKMRTHQQVVYKQLMYRVEVDKSRVITPDGKQLPIDDVWKRAKAGTVIAISGDFNEPSREFLQALGRDTLVVIPPPVKSNAGGGKDEPKKEKQK